METFKLLQEKNMAKVVVCIDQAADATDWIHKHRIIKDYIDDGWIHYMTRAEHVVLWDLCHPASD